MYGILKEETGTIDFPLGPIEMHNIKQMVDIDNGKPSLTYYSKIPTTTSFIENLFPPLTIDIPTTFVKLTPHTGR